MKRNNIIICLIILLSMMSYLFINFYTNYNNRISMLLDIPVGNIEILASQKIENYTSTIVIDKIKQDYFLFVSTDKNNLDLAFKKVQNEKVSLFYYKPSYLGAVNNGYCVIVALNPNKTPYNINLYDYNNNLIFTYMMGNNTAFLKSISMSTHEFEMLELKLIKNSEDITKNNFNIIN